MTEILHNTFENKNKRDYAITNISINQKKAPNNNIYTEANPYEFKQVSLNDSYMFMFFIQICSIEFLKMIYSTVLRDLQNIKNTNNEQCELIKHLDPKDHTKYWFKI